MVQFGINPRVIFVLFPFSGDMEHGMRNGIYLGRCPRRKIGHLGGCWRVSLLGPMNGTVVSGNLGTWLTNY